MTRATAFTVTAADLVEGLLLGTRSGGTAQIANLVRHADGSVDFDLIDHDHRAVIALTLTAAETLTFYGRASRPAAKKAPARPLGVARLERSHQS